MKLIHICPICNKEYERDCITEPVMPCKNCSDVMRRNPSLEGYNIKVYCCNCKYCYWSDYSSYAGDFCCKLGKTIGHNFYRSFDVEGKCETKNSNNNCLDYQTKWWKFWI